MRRKKVSVLLTLLMMTSLMYGQKNIIEDDLYFQPEDRAVVEKNKKPKTKTVYISREEFENKYSTANERNIDEYNRRGQSQKEEVDNGPVFGSESADDNVKYVIVDEDPSQTSVNLYVSPWSVSWSSFSIGFNSMFWWSPYYYSSWWPNYPPYNYGWGWYDPYYSWGWNGWYGGCYPGYHYGWYNNWYNPWWNHHHGGGYYPPYYGWNDHYYRPSYGGRTYSRNGNRTGSGYYNNDRYASSVGGGGSLGGASRYPDRNTNTGKFNPGSRFPNSGSSSNISATTRPENNGQSNSIGSTRTSRTRISNSANTQISAGSSNKSTVVTAPSRSNNRGSSSSQHVINSTGRTRSSSSSSASSSRSSSSTRTIFNSSSSSNNSSYSSGSSGRSSYSSGSSSSGSYSGGRSSGGSSSGGGGGASRGSRSR